MRNLTRLITSILIATFTAVVFASNHADSNSANMNDASASALMQQEQRIEAELYQLKKELKRRKNSATKTVSSKNNPSQQNEDESDLFKVSPSVERDVYSTALNYISGITVTTSPILGLKSAWNASDLLYQVSSMNEDLLLLQERDKFNEILEQYSGDSLDMRPLVVISGGIETRASYSKGYTDKENMDVNLSTAEIDLWAIMSQWVSGFINLNYDDSSPETGSRVTNSRFYLQRGFVTIGNLQQSPFYVTMGQLFLPFGRYSSAVVTTPITKSIGRIEERALVLGYARDGFYFQAYGDKGDRVTSNNNIIFQGGANFGYKNNNTAIGGIDVGMGYTTNFADSQGMQSNGLSSGGNPSTQFAGFSETYNADGTSANDLAHNVGALDFHLSLSRGMMTLITEYITAVERFDEGDLTFDGEGALVSALQTELDFNFLFGKIPLTIGAAYNQSWEALALNVPQQSYFLVASTSLWKNTVESLEFRHDVNYAVTDNTGGGGAGDDDLILPVSSANVGGSQDTITFQLGAYF